MELRSSSVLAASGRCTRRECRAYTVRRTAARAHDDDDAVDNTSIPPAAELGHRRRPGSLDARAPPHPLYIIIITIILIIIIILLRPEPCRVRRRRPARAVHMVNRGLHPLYYTTSLPPISLRFLAPCSLITPLRATPNRTPIETTPPLVQPPVYEFRRRRTGCR